MHTTDLSSIKANREIALIKKLITNVFSVATASKHGQQISVLLAIAGILFW